MRCAIACAGQGAWCTMDTIHRVNRIHKTRFWNAGNLKNHPRPQTGLTQEPNALVWAIFDIYDSNTALQFARRSASRVFNTRCLHQWLWPTHEARSALNFLFICFMTNQDHKKQRYSTVNLSFHARLMTFLKWLCGAQDLNVDNLLCQKRNVIAIETQCDDPAIVHLTCCTAPTTKRASNMTMQEQKKLSPSAL